MRGLRPGPVVFFLVAAFIGAAFTTSATAEDLKGKWYFGGNLSYLSSTDGIRSNAAIIFTNEFGDDGIPFTGDPNELQGCADAASISLSANPFCDPRPDDLLARESTIEETFRYEFTAGYGITSWLNLQFDTSYFKGTVGPVDAFVRETTFDVKRLDANPSDLTPLSFLLDQDRGIPVQAGELTEIPVSLTGIVRFRKDSPLNPYIGAGIGMIFVDMSVSNQVSDLNTMLGNLRIRAVGNQFGKDITPASVAQGKAEGRVPNLWPVDVQVDDAFEWHLVGGAEYFFNDRWSMVFDARYTFADQEVNINLGGESQVDFITFAQGLFRPNGSLRIFVNQDKAPNPLCSEAPTGDGCPANPPPTKHVVPAVGCPNTGDFDKDGTIDYCYNLNSLTASESGSKSTDGIVVVQGGKIDLTAFSVAVGMRWHF